MIILTVPHPILRAVCHPVAEFGHTLQALTDKMLATMYAAPGRGLAAPQVGVARRIFVMDATWKDGDPSPMVFINPVLVQSSATVETGEEGCLSIPDTACDVTRPTEITLRWQALDGTTQEGAFDGFAARCIQHERDHLDGILCTDYSA